MWESPNDSRLAHGSETENEYLCTDEAEAAADWRLACAATTAAGWC